MAGKAARSRGTITFDKGMFHSGDPAQMPDGYASRIENMLSRPNGWVKRPPYVSDTLTTSGTDYFQGFALWDDLTNGVQRLIAVRNNTASASDLYMKSATTETWSGATNFASSGGSLSDFTNYRGTLYFTLTSTLGQLQNPGGLYAWDGVSIKQSPLGGETLYSRTVTSFIDRLFLGNVRASVVNQLGTTNAYNPTAWTAVNTTTTTITQGATVIGRITPTNTTTASIRIADQYTVAASANDTHLVYRLDLRNTSASYAVPFTADIYFSQPWVTLTAYAAGAIRVPTTLNGFRYRVTVAGTAAAGEPVWPTTVGTTVADGTVTWVCEGSDSVAALQAFLPSLSDDGSFTSYWVEGAVPANPASTKVGCRIKFGNDSITTIALTPIDIAQKDGVTDGSPYKKCFGQQLTVGRFQYPFFNQESSGTAIQALTESLYWTETGDPTNLRGSNFYRLQESPGDVTAAATVGSRYVVFKDRGMWVFSGTADPDDPIVLENYYGNVGCIGPRHVIVYSGVLYFVSKYEVYRWTPGRDPAPLAGAAMQSFIFTDPSYGMTFTKASLGYCLVDEKRRDLRFSNGNVYEYVYNLDRECWSISFWKIGILTVTPSLQIFYPRTSALYATTPAGLTSIYRVDETSSAADADSATPCRAVLTLRPLDVSPGSEVLLEELAIRHSCSADQTGSTFTVGVALDDVASFSKTNQVTISPAVDGWTGGGLDSFPSGRISVPLFQTGQRMTLQLVHSGNAGIKTFALAPIVEVTLQNKRDNWQLVNPTAGSANL